MRDRTVGPGRNAPAFFVLAVLSSSVLAQTAPVRQPAQAATAAPAPAPAAPVIPVPNQLGAVKLIASTIIAVDQADKTGNYSVLLGLGSAGFQANNSPASLGAVFSAFRQRQIDLSEVLVLSPTYDIQPTMVKPDTVRMRGRFLLMRGPLEFDLLFKWDNGWRLDGISLAPPAAPTK